MENNKRSSFVFGSLNQKGFGILVFLMIVQLLSFWKNTWLPNKLNALIFVGSSVAFGVFVIVSFWNRSVELPVSKSPQERTKKNILNLILLLALSLCFVLIHEAFGTHPIDVKQSDIIPTIEELCKRQINGSFVYEPIEKFGYHLPVTYLPLQWTPFLIAEYFHFDYRWIAIGIWVVAFLIFVRRSFKYNSASAHLFTLVFSALPFLLISGGLKDGMGGILIDTVEMMVAGYYMLFILSININHPVLRGLIVAICLLSRYSLVLWLPVALIVLWMNEPRKKVLLTLSTVVLFVALVYILPYLSKDWTAFYRGYKYYDQSALGEWQNFADGSQHPYHFYRGFGLASFVNEWKSNWLIIDRIKSLQKIHFFASIGVMLASVLVYFKIKNHVDYKIFLMGSFKVYLAVFLFCIQVPYQYLMLVDVVVTMAIFSSLLPYKVVPKIESLNGGALRNENLP